MALPAADPAELHDDSGAATGVFDLLNRARVDSGVAPLAWSPALIEVAADTPGRCISRATSRTAPRLPGRWVTASRRPGSPTRWPARTWPWRRRPPRCNDGLMASLGHRANILRPEFRRVGIAVVEGPLGLMTVQVFTG